MGTLTNPKHERFVQALFEGETADAAYAKAGYKPNDGNCIRLKGNERVQARLAELQEQAAKKSPRQPLPTGSSMNLSANFAPLT
jgi:phage terminase small subunit